MLKNSDKYRKESIMCNAKVDFILLEIFGDDISEVEIIKNIKIKYPNIKSTLAMGIKKWFLCLLSAELRVLFAHRIKEI